MPRLWLETVHDWPKHRAATWFRARIATVEKSTDPPTMQAVLELVDHGQEGRRLDISLPLPIRPAGLTAEFFNAAGIELRPKGRIRPKDASGQTICIRLDPSTNQAIAFKSISEGEAAHDRDQPAANASIPAARRPANKAAFETEKPDGDRHASG